MVLKNSDPAFLLDCLDHVRHGRAWIDPELTERAKQLARAPARRPRRAHSARAPADRLRPHRLAQPRDRRATRRHRRHGQNLPSRGFREAGREQPHRARDPRRGVPGGIAAKPRTTRTCSRGGGFRPTWRYSLRRCARWSAGRRPFQGMSGRYRRKPRGRTASPGLPSSPAC